MPSSVGERSDVEAEAQRQKTALVFRNAGIAQAVNTVNATLLAWVNVSNGAPVRVASVWWGLVVAIAVGRYAMARRFQALAPDVDAATAWRRRYVVATAVMAAAWGAGTVLYMWNAPDGTRLFTGLVMSGMVAGAVPLLAPVPAAFRIFAALVSVPMSAVMLLQAHSALHWAFGSMSIVFLVAVLASAHYLHETLDVAIRLGLEKSRLVESLERARADGEAALAERERLAGAQRLLQAAVEQSSASIVVTDADAKIIFANTAFTRTTGYSLEEAIGQNPRILKSGQTPRETYRELWAALMRGQAWRSELCNRKKSGELYWEAANITPIVDAGGRTTHYLAVMDDITPRKQAEAEILRLSQWNELLLNSAGEGIYGVDREGTCTFVNPAALTLLGFEKGEVSGKNAHHLFHHQRPDGSSYPEEECPITLTRRDGIRRQAEDAFIRKDGKVLPVQLTVTPMHEDGRLVGVEVVFRDIADRKTMEQELIRLATTDPLTGVANRRRCLELLEMERARNKRFRDPAAFLMVDVDHFKNINDTYGHAIGDAMLKHVAGLSKLHLRHIDLFSRMGGEEFGILLPGTDRAGALKFAEEFRKTLASNPLQSRKGSIPFTVSIGVAAFDPDDSAPDDILARADEALYRAKNAGRNRVAAG